MRIINKKARFNYKIFEKFEAGMVLSGSEVKAIKKRGLDLSHSYAKIINDEVYLVNANVAVDAALQKPTRSRKLLLKKKQIISIKTKIKAKRLTLIPTKVYTRGRLIKAEIALAKAKRKFEKKEAIKKRDIEREIEKEFRK